MASDAPSVAATGGVLNINVGIMGHVDAGKTSLVRALSTELSTASLDKHPQSQERGITLDLGFSAFATEAPKQVTDAGFSHLQFTLVDCPGHASLIRTIIGGAQIIDMMILVIDIVKGIQTQTAECLVIGEIATDNMIVVLNKVDMLPVDGRAAAIERISGKIRKVLQSTKFAHAPFVVMSAAAGGGGKMGAAAPLAPADGGGGKRQDASVGDLVALMRERVAVPRRDAGGPFLFAVDHCFPIKGQGTVLTGTVLSGSCRVNDAVELPEVGQERKIKSMQMFRKPVTRLSQGDRAGICVPGLESSLLERGIACTPGAVPTINAAIALVRKIRFYKGDCASGSKFHVTVGHHTVMATAVFFGALEMAREKAASALAAAADGKSKPAATAAEKVAAEAGTAADADAEAAAIVDEFSSTASGRVAGIEPVADAALPAAVPAAAAPAAGAGGAVAAPRAAASKALASASGAKGAPLGTAGVPVSEPVRALSEAIARRTAELGVPATAFDWGREYVWQDQLMGGRAGGGRAAAVPGADVASAAGAGAGSAKAVTAAAPSKDDEALVYEWQWAALLFETPVQAPLSALVIGSRLDADVHAPTCRLAFFGRLAEPLPSADVHELARCGLYKRKLKQGVVDRIEARGEAAVGKPHTLAAIGGNLFSKGADIASLFLGLRVHTACGQEGVLESTFGKTGKFRLAFADLRRCNVEAAALAAAQDARLSISFPPALAAAVADWNAGRPVVGADAALPLRGSAGLHAPSTPVYITLEAPPAVKPGAQIFLRYRKYQYARKEDVGSKSAGKPRSWTLVQ